MQARQSHLTKIWKSCRGKEGRKAPYGVDRSAPLGAELLRQK